MGMKSIRKNCVKVASIAFLTFLPVVSYADNTNNAGTITNPLGPSGPGTIEAFLLTFLQGAIKLCIPVVALAVIYCGFLFVKAQGNPEELSKAKEALLYTLIGAAILLGAVALTQLVLNTIRGVAS